MRKGFSLWDLVAEKMRNSVSQPKQADMIGHYLHRIDFQVVVASNVLKDLFQTLSHGSLQYKFAVFRDRAAMVSEIINRMFGAFDRTHPSRIKTGFVYDESPLSSPQQVVRYPVEAFYEGC